MRPRFARLFRKPPWRHLWISTCGTTGEALLTARRRFGVRQCSAAFHHCRLIQVPPKCVHGQIGDTLAARSMPSVVSDRHLLCDGGYLSEATLLWGFLAIGCAAAWSPSRCQRFWLAA